MSYKLFIDECGDHSLSSINLDFPVFVLLGCLFEESNYLKTCKQLEQLKEEIFGTIEVVLHSRDIRKCEGSFMKLFDLNVKKSFYDKLNAALTQSDFTIIAVGIKKDEFIKKYGKIADDPYELSLSFLLERAVLSVNHLAPQTDIHVMIESRGKKEDETLQRRYNRLLDNGSQFISPEKFKMRLTKMEFHKKIDNDCGLQVADLCAYPVARKLKNPRELYPPYDLIFSKFRKNAVGKVMGYGFKVFP